MEETFKRNFRRIDDYKFFSVEARLKFEPGNEYSYSNMGMHLLGPIIEKISRENYYSYLKSHMFDPQGMSGADFCETDRPVPDMAIGNAKTNVDGKFIWKRNDYVGQLKGTPAGGAYANKDDLLKFEDGLRNFKLVSEKTRDILFAAEDDQNDGSYDFGFSERKIGEQLVVDHTGGYIGINNHFSMCLINGYSV